MNYFILILSVGFFGFSGCAQSGHFYSSKSKKAIKYFELGKNAPSESIDHTTGGPNFRAGLSYFDKALEQDPDFWEAHMFAGEFCEYLFEYEKAIEHYEAALKINPHHSATGSTYFYLANLQKAVGNY